MGLNLGGVLTFFTALKATISHLLLRLWHSPILLGYLVIGSIAAFLQSGLRGFFSAVINLLLLGIFAVIIHMMTTKKPAEKLPLRRPKIELIAGLVVFFLILGSDFLFFRLTKIPVLQTGFNSFVRQAYDTAYTLCRYGVPLWSADYIGNAITSTVIQLIPTLILFIAFGYGLRRIGLKPRYWELTFVLLGITILFGIPSHQYLPLFQYPLGKTIVLLLISLFINGFPEELFFRGFLLPRLEHFLGNSVNALVVTSLLFNAVHIPVMIANGNGVAFAILNVFSTAFPSGLLWGYLYQRTRSIVPGMLWHTSFGILGGYFISL